MIDESASQPSAPLDHNFDLSIVVDNSVSSKEVVSNEPNHVTFFARYPINLKLKEK